MITLVEVIGGKVWVKVLDSDTMIVVVLVLAKRCQYMQMM